MRFGSIAAGNRDVELGVAPHAVLVHVEALCLNLWRDPDAPDLLQRPEDGEAGAERPGTHGNQAERLHTELVEAAAVKKALRARGGDPDQAGSGEEPAGQRAPDSRHAVHRDGADRVVDTETLDEEHADDGD